MCNVLLAPSLHQTMSHTCCCYDISKCDDISGHASSNANHGIDTKGCLTSIAAVTGFVQDTALHTTHKLGFMHDCKNEWHHEHCTSSKTSTHLMAHNCILKRTKD